jgi:hypothetical protein
MPMPGTFISQSGGALEGRELSHKVNRIAKDLDNLIVTEHLLPYSEL